MCSIVAASANVGEAVFGSGMVSHDLLLTFVTLCIS